MQPGQIVTFGTVCRAGGTDDPCRCGFRSTTARLRRVGWSVRRGVIEREWAAVKTPEPYRAWRDTVNVQPGETVRIATVQEMAGNRMFHCHILEHEDLGMMGTLKVI